jgi:hypothetical protein
MNNRRIRSLERHVLPEQPELATIQISNEQEFALLTKAQQIREKLTPETKAIMQDETLTFDQKTERLKTLYDSINPEDKIIITKDSQFLRMRLRDFLVEYFKPCFPETSLQEVYMRIFWFFEQMIALAVKEQIIDSEWEHNRDESRPDFDDAIWWQNLDEKIAKEFPEGVFTEKTFENVRDYFDEKISSAIRDYWNKHPEEYELLIEKLKYKS